MDQSDPPDHQVQKETQDWLDREEWMDPQDWLDPQVNRGPMDLPELEEMMERR